MVSSPVSLPTTSATQWGHTRVRAWDRGNAENGAGRRGQKVKFFLHCIVCFLDHCQKMCASWSQVVAKRDGVRRQILEKTIITNETLPLFVTTDYIEPFFMSLITIEHLLTVFYSL